MKHAVEVLLFDENDQLVLHRRGPACKDEQYQLEGFGGSIERGESVFEAANREVREEAGQKCQIRLDAAVFSKYIKTRSGEWYITTVVGRIVGEPQITENDKNIGYVRMKLEEALQDDQISGSVRESCRRLWELGLTELSLLDDFNA